MIYSHPNRLLTDHLQSVEKKMIKFLDDQKIDTLKAFGFEKDIFKRLVHAVALSHDLGKATKKFQEKLLGSKVRSPHSEISAIYAYLVTKEALSDKIDEEQNKMLSFYAFVVVRRHHDFLKQYVDEVVDLQYDKDRLIKITNSIDKDFAKWFEEQTHIVISSENTEIAIKEISQMDILIDKVLESKDDLSSYFTINLLYSLLVDADRIDAATYGLNNTKRIDFDTKIVKEYMQTHFKNSTGIMDDLRKYVHDEVLNFDISLDNHFYTITVPTGGGKTLTSFDFALKMRETIKEKAGYLPRIIYALPFTSLIDQNAKMIKDVLSLSGEVSSDLLLIQHHLVPNEYVDDESGPLPEDLSSLLISGWNSEIIMTTFVSLFEGLVSNRRSDLRKLHNMLGSIIILDEIQNIPYEYWELISNIFNFIAKNFGTYFIFMTATKPEILVQAKELTKRNFELNRIKILNESDKINDLNSLYESVIKDIFNGKKVLVVLNTISSSQNFFKMFKDMDTTKLYLSAGVIPKLRKKVIEEIKQGNIQLLVSTQVVEAGMDIDFDVVYRDMAPVDSLIQSCGRCNRNYTSKLGIVHLTDIKDENGGSYSNSVYDDLLIGISKELFNGVSEIFENEIQKLLIDPYFAKVAKNVSQSEGYLKSLKNLIYSSQNRSSEELPISKFSIIKEFTRANIYIQYDQEAVDLWNEFEKIQTLDSKEWYVRASYLFKKMNQYMISVNVTKFFIENAPPLIENQRGKAFYFVGKDQLHDFYDEEIGFRILGKDVMIL